MKSRPIETQSFQIGNTPLTRLAFTARGHSHEVCLKEERASEFGSIKDRVAWHLLSHYLEKPKPIRAVVDASSGNYGYALASICQRLGIACTIVTSPSITAYNAEGIRSAGGSLVMAGALPGESSNAARMRVAGEIAAREDALFLDQYANPLNPDAHETWTAPEVFAEGPFDACFVTSSSGGTARGFRAYIEANGLATRLIHVEPEPSCAFTDPDAACKAKTLAIPGYGSGKRSCFSDLRPDPRVERVADARVIAGFAMLRERALTKIGLSSVGVLLGALDWLSEQDGPRRVACICADGDERYTGEFETRYRAAVSNCDYAAARTRLAPLLGRLSRWQGRRTSSLSQA